jgi:RNA ligase (TIGR02306 family)
MSDWKCQIVKIEQVVKHPDADNLDIVTVLGDYPVVTKRNEYKVGDITAYLSIDTIVPDIEQFYFLCPKINEKYEENGEIKIRTAGPKYPIGSVPERHRIIKSKKIRGIYSQGMLVSGDYSSLSIGDSVVELLNLKKWEEEEEDNLPKLKTVNGSTASPPKNFSIPYYDLESVRKYISCVENEKDIILQEKLNGSNFSAVFDGETLVVKSRNYYKKLSPDDMWAEVAIRNNLEQKLSKYPMIVLFGEIINQIKNFRYTTEIVDGQLTTDLYFFDAYNIKTGRYLDYDLFKEIIDELRLKSAPVLYRGPWTNKQDMYAFAEGKSTLNNKVIREGWVLSLGKERFEPKLNSRLKLKLIGEAYALSK